MQHFLSFTGQIFSVAAVWARQRDWFVCIHYPYLVTRTVGVDQKGERDSARGGNGGYGISGQIVQ